MTETRSCVRARKMTVTTAVSGGKIGVAEAYGATIRLPYLSTAVIVSKGDGL